MTVRVAQIQYWDYQGVGTPIAFNEGQAARLMECVSPRLPFLPYSNAELIKALTCTTGLIHYI